MIDPWLIDYEVHDQLYSAGGEGAAPLKRVEETQKLPAGGLYMIKENNEDFERRWKESHSTVEMVALMLLRSNLAVQILPQKLRPSYEERMDYTDNGDLLIINNGKPVICEVKGQGYDFLGGKHPFNQAYLCNRWSFDNAKQKPSYYFLVEKDRSTCAVFDVEKYRDKMQITTITDKKRPVPETYEAYSVESKYLSYRQLVNKSVDN